MNLENKLPPHLGGHGNITHIDEGALIYLKDKFNIRTMIDVGCGVGGMIRLAKNHDILSIGIDGDYFVKRNYDVIDNIYIHDFTTGVTGLKMVCDLAWSIEFLEHIAEEFLPNVFDTFKLTRYVFCTANPFKNKYHFNPQPVEYWINKFREFGFEFLKKETEELKAVSTMKREFVRNTGMIFKNLAYEN